MDMSFSLKGGGGLQAPANCIDENVPSAKSSDPGQLNTLPNDKFLDWSKFRAFADDKINIT